MKINCSFSFLLRANIRLVCTIHFKHNNGLFKPLKNKIVMEALNQLEQALYNKYSIFNKEYAFIETTKDYLAIICYPYMYEYVERYFNWLVNFCTKFLTKVGYKGFVYIFGYTIEVK